MAPADGSDDEEASGAGSASVLVAPKDARAREKWVAERMTAAIAARPKLAKVKLAVAVTDLTTGKPVWAREGDAGMNLASNAKLLTTIAALGTLGSGFRWRTAVYATEFDETTGIVKGDLHVRGRGDPTLGVTDLRTLATDLAARGVRVIEGKLVIDGSYFDAVVEPPHFDEQKLERSGFRAPVASFGVARSAVTIVVTADVGGTGANIRIEPDAGDYVKITKREVVTITEGRSRVRIDSKPKPSGVEIEISGQIRASEGSWEQRRRIDDPARFAAEVFRRALAERGVKLKKGALGSGAVPPTAKLLAAHDSAPLGQVLRDMNKYSDNYIAESVLKTLGAETRASPGPATWADGTAAVKTYLAAVGLPAGSYRSDNGSGLFGASQASANQFVKLLAAAHHDYRIGPDLLASLPIGGVDGTLARRWHGRPAQGRVRAKTGTLDKVTTLAGYIGVDSGHPLAFAMFANEIPPGQRPAVRELVDELVDILAAYLGATR
ncbi:MAG: D-alanyl-D-alanine carboxypeptidase/D-alanyl-D-alanine-endopeptidase [Deltaproteobacteria bacterium]|nr:D-alanyl-D-alanine carboxypeptidase/D-alanyl-D-alanine-endopeptidase [Deltaproteobacteria bacterium]